MIESDTTYFPMNVVDLFATRFGLIDPEVQCFRRRVYNTDPVQAWGVSPALWTPNQESHEMRGKELASEPTLQRYSIIIQAMCKDTDEERGIAVHSKMSKIARGIVLTDQPLAQSLRGLHADLYGVRERLQRWSIQSQRFLSEELTGQFTYLSSIEVVIETENSRAPSQ